MIPISDTASFLMMLAVKATVVLALGAMAHVLLRRRASAATRHWMWAMAVACLLALPVLTVALPSWTVEVAVRSETQAGALLVSDGARLAPATSAPDLGSQGSAIAATGAPGLPAVPATSRVSWFTALMSLYMVGLFLLTLRLAVQQVAARRLVRNADEVDDAEWVWLLDECAARLRVTRPVRLLRSRERSMPMAIGVGQGVILIPAIADTWSAERRQAVLLHELAHVGRRDCLTQALAEAACALYWPHPGVWWVARRLRVERELACDDRVLHAGAEARDYAGHLLEIAYTLGGHRAPTLAVSMARPGQLEGRMLAVLDTARNRRTPGRGVRFIGSAIAVAALLPLAVVAATTIPTTVEIDDLSSAPSSAAPVSSSATPVSTPRAEASAAAAGRAQSQGAGTWAVHASKAPGMVHLEMREDRSSSGSTVPVSQLEGLTSAQMSGDGGPVRFSVRRDAGTFTFEGTFRSGVGGGTYSFAANPAFTSELEKRGISRPSATEQYELAKHDVGLALVDELNRQGYPKPSVADLVRAGHHGVRLDYVKELDQLGYRVGTMDALVKLRDHGVTPNYIREMSAIGLPKLSADELVRVRDHGVTPEFARALKDAGYGSLTIDQLVKTRDHGVTPEYIRELKALGYGSLDLEQLIKTRDHGVTPEFVKGLSAFGYTKLSLDQVVNARDHGVTPEYISELGALGYAQVPLDRVVNARDHGVTPGYIRDLKALGYSDLPLDEVVRLRDHGVTAERIKKANEKAGTKLPLDMVRSMVDGGLR